MHDKNGKPLKVGDKVLVEATIREVYATPDFCNIQLGIGYEKEHGADNVQSIVTLNSRQVEKVEEEVLPESAESTYGYQNRDSVFEASQR